MESKNINSSRGCTEEAMKVTKIRTMKTQYFKDSRFLAAVIFFYLVPISNHLAMIPASFLVAGATYTTMEIERNVIKANAMKRKLKKIANRLKRECGINVRPKYNYSTRQAGFVLCDMNGKIPITSFLTSNNVSEYLNPEQCEMVNEIIENEFARANSYRGKGDDARTRKEYKYKNASQICLDNITCAFDDVGGVLTNKELISFSSGTKISRIEYKRFMHEHKGESLWVLSGHLSTYLSDLTDISVEDKNAILKEFEYYFSKQGEEGKYEFQKLSDQINEENEIRKIM